VSPTSRGPVVVDTGVFAARLTPSGSLLAARYYPILEGRPAVVSFVTAAELSYGARLAAWGPEGLQRLEYEIARTEVVWPGPSLADAYALLRTWCVRTGHGLGQKQHEADRWVAATAAWLQVPPVTHDKIFANVKDPEVLTRLGE
jgi:predicted nucleic acid-binding protein